MRAVFSSTYDSKYLYYLPIVSWLWNKIGVDVICFMPQPGEVTKLLDVVVDSTSTEFVLAQTTIIQKGINCELKRFNAPEHKQPTYAQVSRLYAAAISDLPEDEQLIISDIDMAVFDRHYFKPSVNGIIDIYGADLVPQNQYPMCYAVANVSTWRQLIGEGTYQEHLDRELAHEECENMRGNLWSRDQENLYNFIHQNDDVDYRLHNRARPGTQFASNRLDRDDAFLLDRLSPGIIDYHLNRPGYEDNNFEKIIAVINFFYPQEDLTWIVEYTQKYKSLL